MTIGCRMRTLGMIRRLNRNLGRRREEGNALVEFAITMPLLLMILTATISFSLAIYILQEIGNATTSSALAVGGTAGTIGDPCKAVGEQIAAMLTNLTQANLTFSVTVTNSSGTSTYGPFSPPTAGTCIDAGNGGGTTEAEANYPVSVTISYVYSWLPFLSPTAMGHWMYSAASSTLSSSETVIAQ